MEMSAEHISQANISNTGSILLILKYQPVENPIPQVYIQKADISNIADHPQWKNLYQEATSISAQH